MRAISGAKFAVIHGSIPMTCDSCRAELLIEDGDVTNRHFEYDRYSGDHTVGIATCPECGRSLWVPIDKKPEPPLNWWEKIFGRDYGGWD